jgi:hypothetical protein
MQKSGAFYPLLLLVFWSALLAAADYTVIDTSVRQALARHFPSTQGKMLHSNIGRGAIMRRGVDFDYSYAVNGVDYTGHRYRYDDHNTAFEFSAVASAHRSGSLQTVYYNPNNPADSLLQPGLDGSDLLLLLFALPFNALTLGLWAGVARARREQRHAGTAGGIRILSGAGETRARLAGISPAVAGVFGLAAAAFVAVFPVVAVAAFAPAMRLMALVWGLVLAAGAACFLWAAERNRSGRYDLRISDVSQTVTLPQTGGRAEPLTLPRAEIRAVLLQRRVTKGPSGISYTYVPAISRGVADSPAQPLKLVTFGWTEAKGRAFGQWLGEQLNVQFKGIEDECGSCPSVNEPGAAAGLKASIRLRGDGS